MSQWLKLLLEGCMVLHFAAMAMCIYRLVAGPLAADRAIALDTLTIVFIGIVSILCIAWQSTLYFDAIWILTLVGFLGSAAIALYLDRGRIF
ncbi:MAG TPA: monovalent cation/H+ antiporter complex subunit F [Candidatus Limnocylindrales bacterium]|nr:monovalent cation/H+ antiporter complex subunit F [Candidatus Limnocylindrales bacterium]